MYRCVTVCVSATVCLCITTSSTCRSVANVMISVCLFPSSAVSRWCGERVVQIREDGERREGRRVAGGGEGLGRPAEREQERERGVQEWVMQEGAV